jgi:hypothetical protein
MTEKDLALAGRKEDVRNAVPVSSPIKFELAEIKEHFDESLAAIKKQ